MTHPVSEAAIGDVKEGEAGPGGGFEGGLMLFSSEFSVRRAIFETRRRVSIELSFEFSRSWLSS